MRAQQIERLLTCRHRSGGSSMICLETGLREHAREIPSVISPAGRTPALVTEGRALGRCAWDQPRTQTTMSAMASAVSRLAGASKRSGSRPTNLLGHRSRAEPIQPLPKGCPEVLRHLRSDPPR